MAVLADIAYARSGDKGDTCNVGIMAKRPDLYPMVLRHVTSEAVRRHLGGLVRGDVTVYRLDNIDAVNVVMRGALGGGATRTVRFDQTGKAMSTAMLRMPLEAAP